MKFLKKENIRIVTLYLKNGNIKSQEGLKFCGFRKYNQALTCFAQARNSFMQLSKLINNDTKNNYFYIKYSFLLWTINLSNI